MKKVFKKRAPSPSYISPNQLTLDCFQTPFEQKLNSRNRWVVLSHLMPWDEVCNLYLKNVGVSVTGRPALSPRVIIGSLIIKHMCNLDDRETVDQISENICMQYFLGYSTFSSEPPFDASLFVDFRKRLGIENLNAINERIVKLKTRLESKEKDSEPPSNAQDSSPVSTNKGRVIFDATACPQDIAYPTDLNLLSNAREKTDQMIDELYTCGLHQAKPLTYRRVARKRYLQTAQKRNKSCKEIRKSVGSQLRFLRRNLISINRLLDAYPAIPLKPKQYKYLLVVKTGYGLNCIKARLKETSESWIACIFLVLNLVKLAGATLPCFIIRLVNDLYYSFSARYSFVTQDGIADDICRKLILMPQIPHTKPNLPKNWLLSFSADPNYTGLVRNA